MVSDFVIRRVQWRRAEKINKRDKLSDGQTNRKESNHTHV